MDPPFLVNVDTTWDGGGTALDADVQHTVLVAGRRRFGFNVIRQADDAAEAAAESFVDVRRRFFSFLGKVVRSFSGQRQYPALDREIDAGGVESGGESIYLDRSWRRADVQGRKAASAEASDTGGWTGITQQLALQGSSQKTENKARLACAE